MLLRLSLLLCLVVVNLAAPGSKLRPTRLTKAGNVCTTQVCQETAASIKQALDTTADPCQDFFQYACGNYPNSVPQHLANYNRFAELDVSNLKSKKARFEQPHDYNSDPPMYKKVKDYYASCVDTAQIQQNGLQSLLRLLKGMGGLPASESFWNEWTSDSWTNVLGKLWDSGLGYNYLFDVNLGVDFKDTSYRPVMLGFPEMTLSIDALSRGPVSPEYTQHFDDLVRIAEALGANPYQAVNDMQNVLRLERALYQAAANMKSQSSSSNITSGPAVKIGDDPKKHQSNLFSTDFARLAKQAGALLPIDLQKLNEVLPSVNWSKFFKGILQTDSLYNLRVFSGLPHYITRAVAILDGTSKRTVLNYFLIRAVLDTQVALDVQGGEQRGFVCAEEVTEKLPLIVGHMFLSKIFKRATKEVADDMVDKLRSIFQKRMKAASWMDNQTRQKAIDKLLNVQQDVAYPEEITDTNGLEQIHRSVTIRSNTYFENRLAALRLLHKMEMYPFASSHKESDWYRKASTITIVNANYYSLANTIWMPAGILGGAFFNADRPQSMNFGGVGAVIGHEFTHGFDTSGRLFTKDGVMEEWWSADTIRKFDTKAQCLIDQFNREYVPEIQTTLDGNKTVGENIADNGGFRQAYEAYLQWMTVNEPEPILPGLNFNQRQLFWLSNANVWCEKIDKDNLKNLVATNEHSPNKYRVNLGFQNFEEFAKDFGCQAETTMNPTKKCKVW